MLHDLLCVTPNSQRRSYWLSYFRGIEQFEPSKKYHMTTSKNSTHESESPIRSSTAAKIIASLSVIAALWWGQRFLIPLVAGLMLAILVMPLTIRLTHWLHSVVAATTLTLLIVISILALGVMAFGGQFVRVIERAPEMISMVAQKLSETEPGMDSVLSRARVALHELDNAADRLVAGKPLKSGRRAVPVTPASQISAAQPNNNITTGATTALRETAMNGSTVLLGFTANLSVILFIAFFVLAGGKPLTEKFLGLWSYSPQAHEHARHAMLESARQIRLYCAVLAVTNTLIGLCVWIAFKLANLPDAAGWGVAAGVLHLVPYLGMAVLTALGAAETFLVHETISMALGMALFLILLSTLIGTFGTAWLQGRAAKMNSAAVFIGLVFWGALWGVWGLFLGPALVVLIKVLAEHSSYTARFAKLMQG
jgi:predicted PurR-regulated permease PerM